MKADNAVNRPNQRRALPAAAAALLMSTLSATAQQPLVITTVAGGGPNNVPALAANISTPVDSVFDPQGNLFVLKDGGTIYRVDSSGLLTFYAGPGLSALALAVDPAGNLYVSGFDNRVRRISGVTGLVTVVAGTGSSG